MYIMPSVATKAGRWNLVTSVPSISSHSRPTASAASAAMTGGSPQSTMSLAKMMPHRPTNAPSAKSINPVQIMKYWPAARMATIDTCRSTFMKLL